MRALHALSAVALKELIPAVCEAGGLPAVERVGNLLVQHFTDHGERLTKALLHSNERAWRTLEVALAGDSLWNWLDKAEDKAFRKQVRDFLDATPSGALPGHGPELKQKCLSELREARKNGTLGATGLEVRKLAHEASDFVRYSDPQRLIQAQWSAIDRVAEACENAGYRALAHLLRLRPGNRPSPPLLAIAVRYFFRRTVESDAVLARSLTFDRLEGIAQAQEVGLSALHDALERNEGFLEQAIGMLDELQRGVDQVNVKLDKLNQGLHRLDVRAELERANAQQASLLRDVLRALEQHRLEQRELRPRDSLMIENENERRLVKQLVARYRSLPPEQQNLPGTINALATLEVAAGEYESAQRNFQQASALVRGQPSAEAVVHYNAYRTALERRAYDVALLKLRAAMQLAPARFALFPLDRYEPRRILGAGGFGVAFLCKHKCMDDQVVVKALVRDDLPQDVNQVFAEARHLRQVNHASVIGIQDCGFADSEGQARPYLVMDYFDGLTLEDHVKRHGPVPRSELPALAREIAGGLQAAHAKGILHRDVKPGNILVRRTAAGWAVKVIDFGLAMSARAMRNTQRRTDTLSRSVVGASLAGTLDYAAPEQMGRLSDVEVSPASDVYGFGKSCCYALFGTPNLSYPEWKEIEGPLADLLGQCVTERPEKRPPSFSVVLERFRKAEAPPIPVQPIVVQEVLTVLPADPEPPRKPQRPAVPEVSGTYEGTTHSTTFGVAGWWSLRLRNLGASGEVRGHLQAARGHDGEGPLSGRIAQDGAIALEGPLTVPHLPGSWNFRAFGTLTGDTITGNYFLHWTGPDMTAWNMLMGNPMANVLQMPQQGTFSVRRVGGR